MKEAAVTKLEGQRLHIAFITMFQRISVVLDDH